MGQQEESRVMEGKTLALPSTIDVQPMEKVEGNVYARDGDMGFGAKHDDKMSP